MGGGLRPLNALMETLHVLSEHVSASQGGKGSRILCQPKSLAHTAVSRPMWLVLGEEVAEGLEPGRPKGRGGHVSRAGRWGWGGCLSR